MLVLANSRLQDQVIHDALEEFDPVDDLAVTLGEIAADIDGLKKDADPFDVSLRDFDE